eukprot:3537068-Pleurochrysis_carterae.AAC.1
MARVTHSAVPPLTAFEAEDTPVLAETGATATTAWCAVATRNGAAQAYASIECAERKRQGVHECGARLRGGAHLGMA